MQQDEKNKVNYVVKEKCDFCENANLLEVEKIYDFDTHLGTFALVLCERCGLYYTYPHPDSETLPNLYKQRDSKSFDGKNSFFFEMLKNYFAEGEVKKYLKSIRVEPEKIVDFGTGNGRFACALSDLCPDSEIIAVDFSDEKPKIFWSEKYKTIKYFRVNDFYSSEQTCDLIFLRHVLEHAESPPELLSKLTSKLSEGGTLILETPNIKSALRSIFKDFYSLYSPPYHLVHFSQKSLKGILDNVGLNYEVFQTEIPIMSNILANLARVPVNSLY